MIQLEWIPNLSGLVQSFDQQQLANFCRILSVTISEPDVGNDDKHTLLAKNAQQKRNTSPSRAEVNQGRWTTNLTLLRANVTKSSKVVTENKVIAKGKFMLKWQLFPFSTFQGIYRVFLAGINLWGEC